MSGPTTATMFKLSKHHVDRCCLQKTSITFIGVYASFNPADFCIATKNNGPEDVIR